MTSEVSGTSQEPLDKIVTGAPGHMGGDPTSAAHVRSRTPFGRLGEPQDVAAAVSFRASDQASDISGVNVMVDGGTFHDCATIRTIST